MNREELRKLKKRTRKDDDYFQYTLKKYIFGFNRFEAHQVLDLFLKDPELKKKLDKEYTPKELKIFNKRMIFNSELSQSDNFDFSIYLIRSYADKINLYLEHKKIYEHHLFVGNYEEAYAQLLIIEKETCLSLWSLGQRMLIEEKLHGLEENKKLLEFYLKSTNKNILINTILEFYSYIAENNMSYLNYQDKVKKFLDSLKEKEQNKILKSYFEFKFNLDLEFTSVTEMLINQVIQIDSQLSIIDLYNSFIEIIQIKSYQEKFDEIKNRIMPLYNIILDNRITNLIIRYGKWELIDIRQNIDSKYSEIIEKYTTGKYEDVVALCTNYLKHNSLDFQLWLIFIKSKILLKNYNKLENTIYNDIYNVLSINKGYKDSLNNLYGYIKTYSGTSWKYKFNSFVKRKAENNNEKINDYISYINDLVITPNYVSITEGKENKEYFLNKYSQNYPYTCELFKFKYNIINNLNPSSDIENFRKIIFISRKKIEEGEYQEAINILRSVCIVKKEENYYIIERFSRELLKAYYNQGEFGECLQLIITSYFTEKNLINRFEINELVNKLKTTRDVNIKSNIMYPILFHINNEKDYKSQRIAFSNYLDYNKVRNINDLVKINQGNYDYLIYFLHRICIQYLLKRDIRLAKNSSEADEVRIEILNVLIDIDPNNKKVYFDEINNIMTRQGIKTRMKQINESRVFVDVNNIKQENLEILLENFKKYILVKKFDEKVKGVDISSDSFMETIKNLINQKIVTDVQYSQEVIILKGIISRIIEEYLYNEKYGLDTFLSSRIRHGYINSQLTTLFYEHNLMSKSVSENSEVYSINEYLDENLIESEEFEKIREFLSDFTNTINKKVLEVKDEWIKIRYNSKDKGLFDYFGIFENIWMTINYDDLVDFDIIFSFVIQVLKAKTNQILTNLRNIINTTLKLYFLNALNILEVNLETIDTPETNKLIGEIKKNINLCKVKFESVIKEFSEVFYLKDISFVDFTMEDLVTICLEINSRLNKNFESISLSKHIQTTKKFDGNSFLYFVDILNVFINNALEHSGFEDISMLNLEIEIKEEKSDLLKEIFKESKKTELKEKEYIEITVKNNLDNKTELDKIEAKVESVFKNISSQEILKKYTQTEGGSGFYKVANILMYNISLPHTIMYEVDEGYFKITLIIAVDQLIEVEIVNENSIY